MKKVEQPLYKQNWNEYIAVHRWVERCWGKAGRCDLDENHVSSRYHWANKSGEYRKDPDDWISLCPSCHYHFDKQSGKRWKDHVRNADKVCGEEACERRVHSSGVCKKHYLKRWRKNRA